MTRGVAYWVACGLGTGLSPVAPGTVGSLAALVAGVAILGVAPALLPLAAVVAVLGGWWAVRESGAQADPGWVVVDEVAGQWIALLPLALLPAAAAWNPPSLLLAFLAFRALDILKPGPVGWADRQEGAFGVMADDVIAGVLAALVVIAAQYRWPARFAAPHTGFLG